MSGEYRSTIKKKKRKHAKEKMKIIKNKHQNKKEKQNANQIGVKEQYLDYLSRKYVIGYKSDDLPESSYDSEEVYKNLKEYIAELYEKQENNKRK